jgi:glycosyltransferase involved in cell wall biosynthesis
MMSKVAMSFSPRRKMIAGLLYANKILRSASCLHVTSDEERDDILVYLPHARIAQVPNGITITPEMDTPVQTEGLREVLHLGRLHPKKAIDQLVDAWARLEADFPEWRLRIVGPSEVGYEGKLKEQASRLGATRISFDGPLYGAEKQAAYQTAQLFVLPTLNENFGLVVAEALVEKTPVICTEGAPWKGLNEHECGWWIPTSTDAIEAALRLSMSLPVKELNRMGKAGRTWMQRDFAWEKIAASMEEVYRRQIVEMCHSDTVTL